MKFLVALFLASSSWAAEPIKVITSTTDLAWAVKEIGGPNVEVKSLLKGTENPHYVDAVPEFIRLASEAKVAIVVGLDLEIGWIPKVLARSGNAQVQPGGKGYAEVGKVINVLEKPVGAIDRSMGDVHPSGNPHFWISPLRFAEVAPRIAETLSAVDPVNASAYSAGAKRFQDSMKQIHARSEKKFEPLRVGLTGPSLMEYHQEFAYFLEAYGLKSMGSIEEKPGVTPSAGRLAGVAMQAKGAGVRFVLAAETAPKKTLERFAELSGLPVVQVPMSMYGNVKDYGTFHDRMVDAVVKALQTGAPRG